MGTFKKTKVVMLPTNEKSKLVLSFKERSFNQLTEPKLTLIEEANYQLSNIQSQHIYFLSDEEIKEGDYVIEDIGGVVYGPIDRESIVENPKKIIATTDKLETFDKTFHDTFKQYLPQPSKSFIEKFVEEYNKGNVITEVLVEYNEPVTEIPKPYKPYSEVAHLDGTLKINPKDNTITIRKMKDSWTREEVIELIEKHTEDMFKQRITLNEWIESNL